MLSLLLIQILIALLSEFESQRGDIFIFLWINNKELIAESGFVEWVGVIRHESTTEERAEAFSQQECKAQTYEWGGERRVYYLSYTAVVMFEKSSYFLEHNYLCVRALFGKTQSSRHGKPGRTHWSRSGGDPCPLERVASQSSMTFFRREWTRRFPWFHSVREALFCTYVQVECCLFSPLGPHGHTAQTCIKYERPYFVRTYR